MATSSKREQHIDAPLVPETARPFKDWCLYMLRDETRAAWRGYVAFRRYAGVSGRVVQDLWIYPSLRGTQASDWLVGTALTREVPSGDVVVNAPMTRGALRVFDRLGYDVVAYYYPFDDLLQSGIRVQDELQSRWGQTRSSGRSSLGKRLPRSAGLMVHPALLPRWLIRLRAWWLAHPKVLIGLSLMSCVVWNMGGVWALRPTRIAIVALVCRLLLIALPATLIAEVKLCSAQIRRTWWRAIERGAPAFCIEDISLLDRVAAESSGNAMSCWGHSPRSPARRRWCAGRPTA